MNISFIGYGNMAKAIAHGLLLDKSHELRAAAPSLTLGVDARGMKTYSDNLAVLPDADVIILAVKPMQMAAVFADLYTKIPSHALVISIAAGLRLDWFTKNCPRLAMVRAMPNIAAEIGQSATPLYANEWVNDQQKQWATEIFTRIGITAWIPNETDMDALTALSGSGPAYVFLFVDAMIQAAKTLGIAEDVANSFALQTAHGALSLAINSRCSLSELRQKVTSPGGTTAAALDVFMNNHFNELIFAAMLAARDKAQELGFRS